jgi:zinc protease
MKMRFLALCALLLALPSLACATDVQRVVSPGGIEAWLIEDHSLPIVSARIAFRGGSATDPIELKGRTRLAMSLLDEGAGDYTAEAFKAKLEELSGEVSFTYGADEVYGSLRTLSKRRAELFDLMALCLTKPRFEPSDVERVRQQIQLGYARRDDNPNAVASAAWNVASFPGHPYGTSKKTAEAGLARVTVDDLKGFVASHLTRDALVVAVAGDITKDQLAEQLDKTFGALPASGDRGQVADAKPGAPGQIMVIQRHIPQSVMYFGEAGIAQSDPDYYAAVIVNYVLGGGALNSVLMKEVREKRGLVYGINTQLADLKHSPLFLGHTATRNAEVGNVYGLVQKIWGEFAAKGLTQKQLDEAKTYLTGSFALDLDSTSALASTLLQMQLDHLGIDYLDKYKSYIDKVTLADANRVAKRLMAPDSLTLVVVGEPVGITPTRDAPAEY